ncbi:MAG: hypothetical protein QM648_04580 [Solirubrobacterales bacterium]
MRDPDQEPRPPMPAWILPTMIGAVLVIALGVLTTYSDTTVGAAIVLLGLIAFVVAALGAGRSSE